MENLCKIRELYRAVSKYGEDFEQKHGIGLNEGMLLCCLEKEGSIPSGEISRQLGLTASNASKVIRSAEEKSLIIRQMGKEDKRKMYFVLSPAGKELLEKIKRDPVDTPPLLSGCLENITL